MMRLLTNLLWAVQTGALIVILWCSWGLLDARLFCLVAAVVALLASLWVEHRLSYGYVIEDET
jgi:hypothetical protein